MGIFETARNNPHIVRREVDKKILNDLLEMYQENTQSERDPKKPGTFEVTYKTGKEARAPSKTDVVPANDIFVDDAGRMQFKAAGFLQLRFPAEHLVSIERLQNKPPFTDFLYAAQQDLLEDRENRLALMPRRTGVTFCMAATAVERAYYGHDVVYIGHNPNLARTFVDQHVHDVAIKMGVDVSHDTETVASVETETGDRQTITAKSYSDPLTAQNPDVVLADQFQFQNGGDVKQMIESRTSEFFLGATGGTGRVESGGALDYALSSDVIKNVYWYGLAQLEMNTDIKNKLPIE